MTSATETTHFNFLGRHRGLCLLFVGIIAAVLLVAYAYMTLFPSATVRYRLILEADVDGKTVTGAGVIQVTRQDTTVIGALGGVGAKIKGEAIAVDLGSRGQFFCDSSWPESCRRCKLPDVCDFPCFRGAIR